MAHDYQHQPHHTLGGRGSGMGPQAHQARNFTHSRYNQNYQNNHHPHPHHANSNQHYNHQPRSKYNPNRQDGQLDNNNNPNHVLLLTVINPQYDITCDIVHQICFNYGKVNRIVIFRKNGVQAMVEFDSVESAQRAKSALNGCEIYDGCCTLRIEYAKPTRLNVHKNDNDSYDYVSPNLGQQAQHDASQSQTSDQVSSATSGLGPVGSDGQDAQLNSVQQNQNSLQSMSASNSKLNVSQGGNNFRSPANDLQDREIHPQNAADSIPKSDLEPESLTYSESRPIDEDIRSGENGGTYSANQDSSSAYQQTDSQHQDSYPRGQDDAASQQQQHGSQYSRGAPRFDNRRTRPVYPINNHTLLGPSQGTVMMVYGLRPDRLNCDRLFNLFCLYGNVARIKFLRSKQGCAMVQMGDVGALNRCLSSLNRVSLFGLDMQVSYSKQPFLHEVSQPYTLPDGSPSFKDFINSKNNRFNNPEIASKNRILPPSPVLHFFNAPHGITEEELVHLFKQNTGYEPVSIKIFTPKVENSKSFSGLAVFKDLIEATEALILCNHMSIPKADGPHPYILRLCFSPPNYARSPYVSNQQDTQNEKQA